MASDIQPIVTGMTSDIQLSFGNMTLGPQPSSSSMASNTPPSVTGSTADIQPSLSSMGSNTHPSVTGSTADTLRSVVGSTADSQPSCLRENKSQEAEVDIGTVCGSGRFKRVYRGHYMSGGRDGEECACKFFKSNRAIENAFFGAELRVVQAARALVERFNSANVVDEIVRLNQPEIWRPEVDKRGDVSGSGKGGGVSVGGSQLCLVEPFIGNFNKYNSNTGWTPLWGHDHQDFWIDTMQALSHFSYHCSGGQALLCDLQGGTTPEGFVLTDPVVMSPRKGAFGPCDMGAHGISTFFFRHQCNMFCSGDWLVPPERKTYYPCLRGSSMELPGQPMRVYPRPYRGPYYYYQPRYVTGGPYLSYPQQQQQQQYQQQQFLPALQTPDRYAADPVRRDDSPAVRSQAESQGSVPEGDDWVLVGPRSSSSSAGASSSVAPSECSDAGLMQPSLPTGLASQAGSMASPSSAAAELAGGPFSQPQRLIKVKLAPYTAP